MTGPDLFEARFAAAYARYLDQAPVAVDAAEVARMAARAHPRAGSVMRLPVIGAAPHLAWLLLLAALLAVAGVGAVVVGSLATRTSEVAPTTAPAPDASIPAVAPSVRSIPSVAPSVRSFPSAPAAGFTVADLDGTWTGDVFVRGFDSFPSSEVADPSKDTTWATTVTLADCAHGASCGSISYATQDAWGTGQTVSCQGTLKYRGPYAGGPAYAFDESITTRSGAVAATSQSRNCRNSILIVTPLQSGVTVGVEEKDDTFLDYGVLVKSATP